MCYHIFRVFAPNKNNLNKIWKVMSKFLWSTKTEEGITHRYKISHKRIELNYLDGGLNLLKPENQSFSIWITSFLNVLKHANSFPLSTLGKITSFRHIPVQKILQDFSFQTLLKFHRQFKFLYPYGGGDYFEMLSSFLYELGRDESTFFHSSILHSQWSNTVLPFSKPDARLLKKFDLITLSSIFQTKNINHKVLILPILDQNLRAKLNNSQLISKLELFVDSLKDCFPKTNIVEYKDLRRFSKPIMQLCMTSPSIYAFHFKRIHRTTTAKGLPPSIRTRKREGLYFPDVEIFFRSYSKIFSLPIFLHYKSFFFEQFIRTLSSKNKLFKFGLSDSNMCSLCHVVSNTEHAIFHCSFPKYFVKALASFLDFKYHEDKPQFIFLRENFFLFNIYYEEFSKVEYIQLLQLILTSKDRFLKLSKEDYVVHWNNYNKFAQTLLLVEYTCNMLKYAGIESNLVTQFGAYIISFKDDVDFFSV